MADLPVFALKAELFRALGHPARVRALEVLSEGERSVGELASEIEVEPAQLSQHLAVLRRSGLVVSRKEGSMVIYSADDPALRSMLDAARRLLIASLTESRLLLVGLEAGGAA